MNGSHPPSRLYLPRIWHTISSIFVSTKASAPWSEQGSYPVRAGNEIQILIDGQAAYREIAIAFPARALYNELAERQVVLPITAVATGLV